MPTKRQINKAVNAVGNKLGDLREIGHEIERAPEHFVKGSGKAAAGLAKASGVLGVDVLKELSGIAAYGARELTGAKKPTKPFKSNLAKGWFE